MFSHFLIFIEFNFVFFFAFAVNPKDVEAELARNKDEASRHNQSIAYYHGNIERLVAEKLLKDYYINHGL